MANLILLNKPFQVLSQFTDDGERTTLRNFVSEKGYYPAGRLDYDSEGLLILTDDGPTQHQLANPAFKLEKTYWVQVEGLISQEALGRLIKGVVLKDGKTKPAQARVIEEPDLWPRNPPIRERKDKPTSWLELKIKEGKNRQVRRMTASVGFPTLRLVRYAIGSWTVENLACGKTRREVVYLATPKKTPATKYNTAKRPARKRPNR
ncbi:MAG: 23S rRNA pseudouridine2457 synthase [Oceanospirillaceae bacterium]|jgi:23S rRNA pseudouridine2457 synthase